MSAAILLAQDAPASCLQAAFFPLMLLAVLYLIVLRPQQKQIQEAQEFRDALKTDDRVITAGGLFGRIVEIDTKGSVKSAVLEVAPKTKIRVALSQIVKRQDDETSSDEA